MPEIADANPALGLRSIRLLLRRPELFETACAPYILRRLGQVVRAAADGDHRRRVPGGAQNMDVLGRLRRRGERLPEKLPPLDVVKEPVLLDRCAPLEADFFAIGMPTADRLHLAVDRGDVASLYDPLHPAVLRLVQFATEAALRMRMPDQQLAARPASRLTPLLLGLGLRRSA